MEILGKVIASVLVVYMIFIYPLSYLYEHSETVKSSYIQSEGRSFVDHICKKGEFTVQEYEELKRNLINTDSLYDIEMIHTHAVETVDVSEGNGIKSMSISPMSTQKVINASTMGYEINTNVECPGKLQEQEGSSYLVQLLNQNQVGAMTASNYWYGNTIYKCSVCNKYYQLFYLMVAYEKPVSYVWLMELDSSAVVPIFTQAQISNILNYYITNGKNGFINYVAENAVATMENKNLKYVKVMDTVYKDYMGYTKHINYVYESFSYIYGVSLVKNTKFPNGENYDTDTGTIYTYTCPHFEIQERPTRKLSKIVANMRSSVIQKYENIPIDSLTLHYDNGEKETITSGWKVNGFDKSKKGLQIVTISYTDGTVTCSTNVTIEVTNLMCTCEFCAQEYELNNEDYDVGCPYCSKILKGIKVSESTIYVNRGDTLNMVVYGIYEDEHEEIIAGWSSDYDCQVIGAQIVTITYKGFTATITVIVNASIICPICNNEYELNSDATDPGCPKCKKKVIGIEVSQKEFSLMYGEALPITVIAIYEDGKRAEVNQWSSNYNEYSVGRQEVEILCFGYSEKIIVTVQKKESIVTCDICNETYDKEIYQGGCPNCYSKIDHITASLISSGSLVQLGSELRLRIIVIYKDNHRETKYSGYIVEGYDKHLLGEQLIKVLYQEFSYNLNIEVVNSLQKTICSNGHVYSLNEDGSDPGCPYCDEDTKNIGVTYMDTTYTTEILEELYRTGSYKVSQGDYFTIEIKLKRIPEGITKLSLTNWFLITQNKFIYGGQVNE